MADPKEPNDPTDVIPLSRFAATLFGARPDSRKRLEAIFGDKDPAAKVASMPVTDLFYLISDVGIEGASDLVALATTEQVQGFLDLAGWSRDQLDDAALRPWLSALVGTGYKKLTHVWRDLDQELTALLLARWTRIYNLAEEELPDWEEPPFFPTPDRFFMVKITAEDPEDVKLVERLLDGLYRGDNELARHTLRSAMSEPVAHLEELAYRWKSGRMQDLGYADYHEALEIYRPIDLAKVVVGEDTADHPIDAQQLPVRLGDAVKQPFLGRVLAQIVDAHEAQRLETAIAVLLNEVLSANRVAPGDEKVAEWAKLGAATLSLGLETVARGDVTRGVEALATVALSRLHRAGYTVLLALPKLMRALGPLAVRADEPLSEVMAGLRAVRPLFVRALETPPAAGGRAFASVADVRVTAAAIATLAAQIVLVRDVLGGDPPSLRTLGDVGRTAVAHVLLGAPATAEPLTAADVGRIKGAPEVDLDAPFRALAERKKIALPPEFLAVLRGWATELRHGTIDQTTVLLGNS